MEKITKREAVNLIKKTAEEEGLALYVCECYDMHLVEVLLKDSLKDDGINSGVYGFNFHLYHGFTKLKGDKNKSNFFIVYNGLRNQPNTPFSLYRLKEKVYLLNKRTGAKRYIGRISSHAEEDKKKLSIYEKSMKKTAENIKKITNFKELNKELKRFEKLSKNHSEILNRKEFILKDDFLRFNYYDEFIF